MPEVRKFVEVDPTTGAILHICEATFTEPDDTLTGAAFTAAIDQRMAQTRQNSEGKGRTFLTHPATEPLPDPVWHKYDKASDSYVKKTKADFGSAPQGNAPDLRPDPANAPPPPRRK